MICIILGTRPEIIKMSPIIRECSRLGTDYFILHTGQHYTYEMDKIFFSELSLPPAKYNLDVGSGTHGEQTGKMLTQIEKVLLNEKPDVVLVEGDTNTVVAGALAASKIGIKVGHVEAGLRSYDRSMPEELNRIVADHLSDYLFAPTQKSMDTLLREGIPQRKIFVTGNTIVDAVIQNIELSDKQSVLDRWKLERKNYILLTAHRQENVDDRKKLNNIIDGLRLISEDSGFRILFPIHPRTRKRLDEFSLWEKINSIEELDIIEPVGFLDILVLESSAKLVITDSGGLQEESCILHTPCITIRENTERPETVEAGANVLVGTDPQRMLEGSRDMMSRSCDWNNPFGDGSAGKRIVEITLEELSRA